MRAGANGPGDHATEAANGGRDAHGAPHLLVSDQLGDGRAEKRMEQPTGQAERNEDDARAPECVHESKADKCGAQNGKGGDDQSALAHSGGQPADRTALHQREQQSKVGQEQVRGLNACKDG